MAGPVPLVLDGGPPDPEGRSRTDPSRPDHAPPALRPREVTFPLPGSPSPGVRAGEGRWWAPGPRLSEALVLDRNLPVVSNLVRSVAAHRPHGTQPPALDGRV